MEKLTSASVFEQYGDKIRRYILGMVHNPTEADDLTQETFLRVHRRLKSLNDPAALSVWIYRIATNVCYDRFRQSSYRHSTQSLDITSDDNDVETEDVDAPRVDKVIGQAEMTACVGQYLDRLSDSYRTVILLHDLHGMTNPEIAEHLGCSLATVKIRLHRARRRLKAALSAGCNLSHDKDGSFICEPKPHSD